MSETWTYVDDSTIEIAGDVTARYWPNLIISVTQDGAQKFFVISAVNLGSGNTRLTLNGCGIYVLNNAVITAHAVTQNRTISGLPSGFGSFQPDKYGAAELTLLEQGSNSSYKHYPNVVSLCSSKTLTGAWVIHTPISRTAFEMFRIRVHGYLYNHSKSVDFTVVGYSYGDTTGNVDGLAGAVISIDLQDNGSDGLKKYVGIDAGGKVAIAFGATETSIYFGRVSVDLYATRIPSTSYLAGWSIDQSTIDGFGWLDIHGPLSSNLCGAISVVSGSNNIYVGGNGSFDSITDRTPVFIGDALAAINKIKATNRDEIDHATLPEFAVMPYIDENGEWWPGRSIGDMVSVLTKGVQELLVVIEDRDAKIEALSTRLKKLEDGLKMSARI
jgi:hypothetical protein